MAGHAVVFMILEVIFLLYGLEKFLQWLWVCFYFFDVIGDKGENFLLGFFLSDLVCEVLGEGYK